MLIELRNCRVGPFMFLGNDNLEGHSLKTYGEYEWQTIELFKKLTDDKSVFVDTDALYGNFVVPMARHMNKGFVLAFEPRNAIYNILCGNVAANNIFNVRLVNRILGNEKEQRLLNVFPVSYDCETDFSYLSIGSEAEKSEPVYSSRIDEVKLARLDLVKIRNNALNVLMGAKETITRTNPFLYISSNGIDHDAKLKDYVKNEYDYVCYYHRYNSFNPGNLANKKEDVINRTSAYILAFHSSKMNQLGSLVEDMNLVPMFEELEVSNEVGDFDGFMLPKVFAKE